MPSLVLKLMVPKFQCQWTIRVLEKQQLFEFQSLSLSFALEAS